MRVCAIASGSSGNCVYVGHEGTHLLVDAGISGKRIETALDSIGIPTKSVKGILITHEHSDHIQGIGVLARRYGIPLYGTAETLCGMLKGKTNIGRIPEELLHEVKPGETLLFDGLTAKAHSVSHDAANPVCYTFEADGKKAAMVTDLGTYDEKILEAVADSEILYLESNHDVNMLMVGSYPYYLKQRILGERGHLSNDTAAKLLCEVLHPGLRHVILAHLSKENNLPELAYETVRIELQAAAEKQGIPMPDLFVAERDIPSRPVGTEIMAVQLELFA
ncbi:MAG: MBL fold metallo-hydrolase [Lachnospiraceae bacterium]|nr:MBL fold metallo-hydrolase [Lachnospiraceae bacterium]